ncbi:caspase family protein [Streptomyces longispororuber]|uniref:caspase family protein n=1 Tax=Streptomyces longispororuber TaxID=68230 RepID=UPI00210D75C0|nr:caspase family protein [Streptomyces longispororuber]MCQ4209768.1 caspase family protein [Streptomyces longispororuber]
MNEARRALLLGVGRASGPAAGLEPLDEVIDADLRRMESALVPAGYHVEIERDAHRSTLKKRIYEFARDVPPGGTVLLYFTGHGITVGGKDYLVPADAVWPSDGVWQELYTESLLPAGISSLLKDCKAETVLWVIDACRSDDVRDGVPFGSSIDSGPPSGDYAVLTGCARGERSGYGPEGSFFTQGLAEALGPLSPARTVTEVFAAARAATTRAARGSGLAQTPAIKYVTQDEARARDTEICSGRSLMEDWLAAALDTPLWSRVEDAQQEDAKRFKKCLATFVEQCARTLHLAQGRLPHTDPWADDTFVVRLLRERLPQLLPAPAALSAIEVAALVAATFLHEVTWAEWLSQAAEADPYTLGRRTGTDALRRHYEQICEQHRPVARRAADCQARGRERDATAVTMWLVHRWIADRFETDDEPVTQVLAKDLLVAMGISADRAQEPAEGLCTMAAQLGVEEPDRLASAATPERVLVSGGHQALRIRPLTLLLRLAAVLAVDVRRFPDVVAEHFGVTDPVLPEQVIGVARELGWVWENGVLHLDAPCPHQAVHAALSDVVDRADELVAEIAELAADLPAQEEALLVRLPRRVTDRDLRPNRSAGQPSYDVPLLRFHLAQTEVRELLMGEQLYGGEPNLALRELYQNSMDACRYRAMRWRYLRSRGTVTDDWTGEISITEGEDERGRYVQCQDNGVGMSAEQLKHTFTRAGSRFERSKSFRREQARWLRHDPALRLYPNSRFGIGVFSYFMLAEEMTIFTRQVSPEGIPAEHALRVDIPSSGSLFRIQQHTGPGDGLAGGGTRIRLYLRDGALSDGASCVSVLRELVRVSEFDLTASDADGRAHRWRPGVLQPSLDAGEESLEAVPGTLWWVKGQGAMLCDGIVTDQKPFGCVLNLTGEHAGVLSVSRKELQDYDREWAAEQWRLGATALSSWPRLTMEWLWDVDERNPDAAVVLGREWRGLGLSVAQESGEQHDLDVVGWFSLDAEIVNARPNNGTEAVRLAGWRQAVLRAVRRTRQSPIRPQRLDGYPRPEPGDAALASMPARFWPLMVQKAAARRIPLSEVVRRQRRLLIAASCWIPPLDPARPHGLDFVPDDEQAAFAGLLEGSFDSAIYLRERWVPTAPHDLPRISAKLLLPLGTLAAQLTPFEKLGAPGLPDVPERHLHHVCDGGELNRLFVKQNYHSEMARLVSTPAQVRAVCEETGDSPAAVLEVLREHAWLGWTVPALDEVLRWMDLSSQDFALLSRSVTPRDGLGPMLSWNATVTLAEDRGMTLGEAEDTLASLAATLDLRYTRRYSSEGHPARQIRPTPETSFFARRSDRFVGAIPVEAPLSFLKGFSDETLDQLRLMGVCIPEAYRVAQLWDDLPLHLQYALGGKEYPLSDDSDFPANRFTSATLFNAAALLQEPLHRVDALFRERDDLGLEIPDIPQELRTYQPSREDCTTLLGYVDESGDWSDEAGEAVWIPLTPPLLAHRASRMGTDPATAYRSLEHLRPLGALIAELSPAALSALDRGIPDEYDLHVLQRLWPDTDDGSAFIAPLKLVRTAARIGESPARTASRIEPYLPLCDPRLTSLPDLSAAPDVIPLWQDLIILTRHLDGRTPAVEGSLTAADLARAADAVGESTHWVAERLSHYADLFGLHITEEPTDA